MNDFRSLIIKMHYRRFVLCNAMIKSCTEEIYLSDCLEMILPNPSKQEEPGLKEKSIRFTDSSIKYRSTLMRDFLAVIVNVGFLSETCHIKYNLIIHRGPKSRISTKLSSHFVTH